ncbi:MAG: phosphoribosyltransferase [Acidobacteriaceae bacterium]|nr:phosphoribosyltransferase [Acidobacteriaceae bacterium]
MDPFLDRREAGRQLAAQVKSSISKAGLSGSDVLVLALPRGGAPVGIEVARALQAELDVFLVRKLGVPDQEELALGAIASGGVRVLNRQLIEELRLSSDVIEQVSAREQTVLEAREKIYREGRPRSEIAGRAVVLVDDGLATGASMLAAARAVRREGAGRVIVAVPVASREACSDLSLEVDQVICAATPHPFGAVGFWYRNFAPVTDDEVRGLLEENANRLRIENAAGRIQPSEGSL